MIEQQRTFLQRVWGDPPVVFSVGVIFHLFLMVRGVLDLGNTLLDNWPTVIWYIAGFVLAVFCMLLQRRAGIGYIVLTSTGLLLQFVLPVDDFWKSVGATLFPFDILMCFFLLFFYKRFR